MLWPLSELGEVLELMHGAHGRFRTLRATIREWRHLPRSDRAFEREVKESGATAYGVAFLATGMDEAEEEEARPEVSESILRLWVEGRSRVREERESRGAHRPGPKLAIKDGGIWWTYDPEYGAMSNVDEPEVGSGVGQETEHLLDPSRLLSWADFTVLGRTTCAGREALRVLTRPRTHEHLWPTPGLPLGADEHELLVDAERGILLRTATRMDGQDLQVVELLEVAFDETFPPETFTFVPPPGEEIRSPRHHLSERLSVEDAAARAPFPVWVIRTLPEGWRMTSMYMEAQERPRVPATVVIHLSREDASSMLQLHQTASAEPAPDDFGERWRALERAGEELKIFEPDEAGYGMPTFVRLERDGTRIDISSGDLGLEELLSLTDLLVRVPTERRGFS